MTRNMGLLNICVYTNLQTREIMGGGAVSPGSVYLFSYPERVWLCNHWHRMRWSCTRQGYQTLFKSSDYPCEPPVTNVTPSLAIKRLLENGILIPSFSPFGKDYQNEEGEIGRDRVFGDLLLNLPLRTVSL
ncbi:hypothetical protein Btru_065236 [Bulinus truncatus]|nr:hypothetical protein Btru_065236 [Bulinus truncatus]